MATKKGGKNDEIDLNDGLDEFDDFGLDFDDGLDDFSFEEPKDDRKPVTKVATSFVKGVGEDLIDTDQLRRRAARTLPAGYGQAIDVGDQLASLGSDLYNTAAAELRPMTQSLKRATRRIPASLKEKLPKKLQDKLDAFGEEESKFPNENQIRESGIQDSLAQIFKLQIEKDQTDRQDDVFERRIRDSILDQKQDTQLDVLHSIAEGVSRQVGYQDDVTSKYQQKNLELQYRQYYVLHDMFELSKAAAKDTKAELENITKNTGLPETEKVKLNEQAGYMFRERLINSAQSAAHDFGRDFIGNLGKNLNKRVQQGLSGFRDGMIGYMDQGEMVADMGQNIDPYTTIGDMAGREFGRNLGDKAADWLKPMLENNPFVKKYGNKLSVAVQNMPMAFNTWARTPEDDPLSPMGMMRSWIKESIPTYRLDDRLDRRLIETADQPATFNNLTRRSITEIIPGYLSRIHHELMILRTGDPDIDRVTYSLDKNEFTSVKTAANEMKRRLFNETSLANLRETTDEMLTDVDPSNELSDAARKALADRMLRDAAVADKFDIKRYFDPTVFKQVGLSDDDAEQLTRHMKSLFELDEKGKAVNSESNAQREAQLFKKYLSYRNNSFDPTDAIRIYKETGNVDQLKELGLINEREGISTVNRDRIWSILQGDQQDERAGERNKNARPYTPNSFNSVGYGDDHLSVQPPSDRGEVPQTLGQTATLDRNVFDELMDAYQRGNRETIEVLREQLTVESGQEEVLHEILSLLESGDFMVSGGGEGRWDRRVREGGNLLRTGFGKAKSYLTNYYKSVGKLYKGGFTKGLDLAREGADKALDWGSKFKADLKVKGSDKIKLYWNKMKDGDYIDAKTGKVIESWKDIQGEVQDRMGNVVLSADDWARGLVSRRGELIAKGKKILTNYFNMGFKPLGIVKNLVTNTWKTAKAYVEMERDIYVPGEKTPRILVNVLKKGGYLSKKTGKPIYSWKDIDGPITDLDGNVVLSLEDMAKGLVDVMGAKIESLKTKALKLLRLPLALAGKGFRFATKLALNAKQTAKDLITAGAEGFGSTFGGGKGIKTIQEKQLKVLQSIEGMLAKKFGFKQANLFDKDGDGDRDGSWLDIFKLRKKKKEEKKDEKKGDKEEKDGSLLGKLFPLLVGGITMIGAKLTSLVNFFMGKKAIDTLGDLAGNVDVGGGKAGKTPKAPKAGGSWMKRAGGKVLSKLGGAARWGLGLLASPGAITALGSAATAIGSGIATVAGGAAAVIGSVISAPVVLGAAAVAAVGVGGYLLFKKWKRSQTGPILRFRLAQYGIDYSEDDAVKRTLWLEDYLKGRVTTEGGQAYISTAGMNVEELFKGLGLDINSEADFQKFITWFEQRFKPVFTTHITALNKVTERPVELIDVDDKLSPSQKMEYLKLVQFPMEGPASPYSVPINPFTSSGESEVDGDDIEDYYKAALRIAARDNEKDARSAQRMSRREGITVEEATKRIEEKRYGVEPKRSSVVKADAGKMMAVQDSQKLARIEAKETATNVRGNISEVLTSTGDVKLDELDLIRFKIYGLKTMDHDKVDSLIRLEQYVAEYTTYEGSGIANAAVDPGPMYQKMAPLFGVSATDPEAREAWLKWWENRFLPVFMDYLTAIRTLLPNLNPLQGRERLTAKDKLVVAKALVASEAKNQGVGNDYWGNSPWPGYILASRSDVTAELDSLKAKIKDDTYNVPLTKKKDDKPEGVSEFMAAGQRRREARQKAAGEDPAALNKRLGTVADSMSVGNVSAKAVGPTNISYDGAPVEHPGSGSGGDINSLPVPEGNGTWDDLADLIVQASKMAGVDPGLMATMAAIESGFNYNAQPKDRYGNLLSSAKGLYQFIDGTWKTMLNKYGAKYGISPDASPFDPRANALMGAEFLKENEAHLTSKLGRPVTDTDLYAAHFLGAGGAVDLLSQREDANAVRLMPSAASKNQSIFYHNGKARTVAGVYKELDRRVASRRDLYAYEARNMFQTVAENDKVATAKERIANGNTGNVRESPTQLAADEKLPPKRQESSSIAKALPPVREKLIQPDINQSTGLMKASDTTGDSSATVEYKRQLNRQQVETKVQDRYREELNANAMAQVVSNMEEQVKLQTSMDKTLKSIDEKLGVIGKHTEITAEQALVETKADKPEVQRGHRPTQARSVSAPISLSRVRRA